MAKGRAKMVAGLFSGWGRAAALSFKNYNTLNIYTRRTTRVLNRKHAHTRVSSTRAARIFGVRLSSSVMYLYNIY
eukprot:6391707-Pyramimonas_sp.AAC.2